MPRKKRFEEDEFEFEANEDEDKPEGFFGHLHEADDECPSCGYYGPMKSTAKGYRCMDCNKIVHKFE